jgi:hypothetical protein
MLINWNKFESPNSLYIGMEDVVTKDVNGCGKMFSMADSKQHQSFQNLKEQIVPRLGIIT